MENPSRIPPQTLRRRVFRTGYARALPGRPGFRGRRGGKTLDANGLILFGVEKRFPNVHYMNKFCEAGNFLEEIFNKISV